MSSAPDRIWGPARGAVPGILVTAVAALVWAVLTGSAQDRVVAGFLAVVLVVVAGAAWSMRQRLAVSTAGLTVRGPGTRRVIAWADVLAVSAPRRRRRGLASTSLEIDLVDDELLVFHRAELGADPDAVAAELLARRPDPAAPPTSGPPARRQSAQGTNWLPLSPQ